MDNRQIMNKKSVSKIKLALFDVDETLFTNNSMLEFIHFFFNDFYGEQKGGIKAKEYQLSIKQLRANNNREDLNRFYYAHYKGINKTYLQKLGKQWFEKAVYKNQLAFNQTVLSHLNQLKQDNYRIILVSGGFFAPLDPIAAYIESDALLCVTPEVKEGLLTGNIMGIQTIGEGKASAIIDHCKNKNIDWLSSYAYGDHCSDLPMLKLVGNPVVVGCDTELLHVANQLKWKQINLN